MASKFLKSIEPGGRAEYGLDSPGSLRNLVLLSLVNAGLAVGLPYKGRWKWLRACFGWGAVGAVLVVATYFYHNKRQKFKHRARLLELAHLKPEARVLDLGSGRGLLAIGAAKRWPDARITAVDSWQSKRLIGNSEENLRSNLDLEDLGSRIHVYEADPRQLPFEPGLFDLIISNHYLYTIGRKQGNRKSQRQARTAALAEIVRVLAPSGCAILSDARYTGEYRETLKRLGLEVELHGSFWAILPVQRIVIAYKPTRSSLKEEKC